MKAEYPGYAPAHITVSAAEEWMIKQARVDPYYFIWYITGFKPARHHEFWLSLMFHPDKRRINLIAFRESAKTTIAVYSIAWMLATEPLKTFGILAVSATVARDRLLMLRGLFSDNVRFRNVFPWIEVDQRRSDTQDEFSVWDKRLSQGSYGIWRSLIVTQQSQLVKNPSIFASGVGGKGIIGRRVSGAFLLDDMVDETYLSAEMQEKMMNYIARTLEPCVGPDGRMINIGTRWMIGDIYQQLAENPAWTTMTIPAIIYDEYQNAYAAWPEFWSLERLAQKQANMDDDLLFKIMYLCDATAITAAIFSMEVLRRDLPEVLPDFTHVYVVCDTATSMRDYADYNVIYIIGIDTANNVYVLDGMRFKEEAPDTVSKMIQMWDAAVSMYDKVEGLYIEVANAEGVFRMLIHATRPDIPVKHLKPTVDKMARAKQASIWWLRGKGFINQKINFIDNIHSEWFNFPVHKHDDTLDPVSSLIHELKFAQIQAQLLRIRPTATAIGQLKKNRQQRLQRKTGFIQTLT